MAIPDTLRTAVVAADPPVALRQAVADLRAAGRSRAEVSNWLNDLLLTIRRDGASEVAEAALLDTLDAVEGWCHPSARLFPEPPA